MAPSKLKTRTNGILKIKNNAIDNTINFCSCLFFIDLLYSLKIIKKSALQVVILISNKRISSYLFTF